MNNNDIKKLKTKKELRKFYGLSRSTVGMARKLGTVDLNSPKDYDRKRAKREIRKEIMENM